MSRLSKILAITIVLMFVMACNVVTQPLRDAENLAATAQALGSAIPAETLQALPSMAPTLEAFATEIGNMFEPQGAPVAEWRDIPVMPEATAGQEFAQTNTYSFRVNATAQEVQDFYNQELPLLDWNQPFELPMEGDAGIMVFQKEGSTLTITITASEGSSVVILTLA